MLTKDQKWPKRGKKDEKREVKGPVASSKEEVFSFLCILYLLFPSHKFLKPDTTFTLERKCAKQN